MSTNAQYRQRDDSPVGDHIVHLHDVSWEDYERLLAMRGDRSASRIGYLEGEVEIMSPSQIHEGIKSLIGRLVETYCLEADIPFNTFGSWTLAAQDRSRGAEPDECLIFGQAHADRPHLAIDVVWTSGRIYKLDIYRKLGVPEVWSWRQGRIQAYCLRGERYVPAIASEVLPGLDLEPLTSFLDRSSTSEAIRGYGQALRSDHSDARQVGLQPDGVARRCPRISVGLTAWLRSCSDSKFAILAQCRSHGHRSDL